MARALSIVGERWTMLIIRDAFLGTRRSTSSGQSRHHQASSVRRLGSW